MDRNYIDLNRHAYDSASSAYSERNKNPDDFVWSDEQ